MVTPRFSVNEAIIILGLMVSIEFKDLYAFGLSSIPAPLIPVPTFFISLCLISMSSWNIRCFQIQTISMVCFSPEAISSAMFFCDERVLQFIVETRDALPSHTSVVCCCCQFFYQQHSFRPQPDVIRIMNFLSSHVVFQLLSLYFCNEFQYQWSQLLLVTAVSY